MFLCVTKFTIKPTTNKYSKPSEKKEKDNVEREYLGEIIKGYINSMVMNIMLKIKIKEEGGRNYDNK